MALTAKWSAESTAPEPAPSAKVCIVGAGVTGLCACKHLLQHGVESVVLEAQSGVGGVWRNTFSSTRLQTPRDAFQYSDFLWPPGTPRLPTHLQVMEYLESYARKFHLMERIVFNCRVVEVRAVGHDGDPPPTSAFPDHLPPQARWAVCVTRGGAESQLHEEWLYFEHLLMCVGHYGDVPKLPTFAPSQGPQVFRGKVLHSLDYSKLDEAGCMDLLSGKRVVVVGSRKSALDLVMEASNHNRGHVNGHTATLLFRTPHWLISHHHFYGVPMSYMTSRFSQLLVPQPGGGNTLHAVISTALSPLRWALSKVLEYYLLSTLPLVEHELVPTQNLFEEFKSCKLTLLPDHFFDTVKQGHVKLRKTTSWCFSPNGIALPNGDELKADVIILCTGYDGEKKLKSLLGERFHDLLQERDGSIPLYRGVLPPRIPHLAVLGFQESYSNLFSAEMSARWVAHWISGKIRLPTKEKMEKEAHQWLNNTRPFVTSNDKTCVNSTALQLADKMCHDMGWTPRRKKSLMEELFAPYGNMDYKDE